MAAESEIAQERLQDFIFARELAEVYLLLDHLSERSDKSLITAFADKTANPEGVTIHKICEIGWPPKGTNIEQAAQAETLLLAKDMLNAVAKPASGISIAFTIMVAGDEDEPAARSDRSCWAGTSGERSPKPSSSAEPWYRRPPKQNLPDTRSDKGPGDAGPKSAAYGGPVSSGEAPDAAAGKAMPATPPDTAVSSATPAAPPDMAASSATPAAPKDDGGGKGDGVSAPAGIWAGQPPSRISLARLAYPGLKRSARLFKRRIQWLLALLFLFLVFTCALSWNISAGRAILTRLDAIEADKTAIQKRITDAEVDVKSTSTTTPAAVAGSAKPPVQRYCERASRLPPPKDAPEGLKIDQFEDATQLQICDKFSENRINYSNAREDIADWLAPWSFLKWFAHKLCGGRCLTDKTVALAPEAINQQQWAAVLVELLATAVLPLCYGFLGAGAAVVRNIWGKMRDSRLLPRDLTLSLGQLALGAVIGACIGLFVAPGGTGSQAGGLTGTFTLTPSALSFIAGFGVESVFVALESFIGRVFNTANQPP
jgi:hypothetical protein